MQWECGGGTLLAKATTLADMYNIVAQCTAWNTGEGHYSPLHCNLMQCIGNSPNVRVRDTTCKGTAHYNSMQ